MVDPGALIEPGDVLVFGAAEAGIAALWQDAASRAPQPGKTWVALSILAASSWPGHSD